MSWNLGYNTDMGYTYGHYREQDPAWLDLCAWVHGARPPTPQPGKRLRYLELGCGQGVGLLMTAAIYPHMEFVGIDYNPEHIAHAQGLARAAGVENVRFVEGNFVDLGQSWPQELGAFHYASAHGILSWVAPVVRQGLYACLDAALLPGGLFYCSYNALPGWLSAMPMQHLLRLWQLRESMQSLMGIEVGISRLEQLCEVAPTLGRRFPEFPARVKKLRADDRRYATQEYLNDVWTPYWFDQMERELSPHKLLYIGTATSSDWFAQGMLTAQGRKFLSGFSDPVEKEVMLDVMLNQSFRRDLWVRGRNPAWPRERSGALLAQRVALMNRPHAKSAGDNPYRFSSVAGEIVGTEEIHGALYDALATGPKTLAELLQVPVNTRAGEPGTPKPSGRRSLIGTLQAVGLMLQARHLAVVPAKIAETRVGKALNRVMIEATSQGAPYHYLVATAVPAVIYVPESDQLLCSLHFSHPKADSKSLAGLYIQRLRELDAQITKNGAALTEPAQIEQHATSLANDFMNSTLARWKRLGVV